MTRGQRVRQARSEVLWCLAGFCALQLGLVAVMESWRPEFRDPQYGSKRALLRRRLRENPGRPLALVLGSSRVQDGLRPKLLPVCPTRHGQALVFNFGMTASGPLHQLLCLHRLLADGHRPRWVFVEVVPSLLPLEDTGDDLIKPERQGWADLAFLRRYCAHPGQMYLRWAQARLVPWFSCRFCLLSRYRPSWIPPGNRGEDPWHTLDRSGWLRLPSPIAPAAYARGVDLARREHAPALQHFHIAPAPDRALRELLALCRQERIEAALLVMPEGSAFRNWYSPAARARFGRYLAALSREYGAPVVDARTWVPDDGFCDGHHLVPDGAALFTYRFGREALGPFLAGSPLPPAGPECGRAPARSSATAARAAGGARGG
jgi:hypothetical protein